VIVYRTGGNSWSTGPAPPPPPFTAPPHSRKRGKSPGQHSNGSDSSNSDGSSGIGAGAIAGIVVSILVVGALVAFFLIKRKQRKGAMPEHFEQRQPFNSFPSNEVKGDFTWCLICPNRSSCLLCNKLIHMFSFTNTADMKPIEEAATIEVEPLPSPATVNTKPPLKIERNQSFEDDDGFANKPAAKKVNAAPVNAKVYSVADLQMATDSFSMDNLVGEDNFGRVYRAQFNDGKVNKLHYSCCCY
jgi:hypothetical protein